MSYSVITQPFFSLTGGSNIFFLNVGGNYAIVEASLKSNIPAVKSYFRTNKIDPDKVKYIFITHHHFDHSDGCCELKKLCPKAKVIMHKSEQRYTEKGVTNTPKATGLFTSLVEYLGKSWIGQKYMSYEPFDVDDDKMPEIGEIVHTPGHSPGSVSLVTTCNGKKTAFVGDLLRGPRVIKLEGSNVLFCDHPEINAKSVKLLKLMGVEVFVPSHGGALTKDDV